MADENDISRWLIDGQAAAGPAQAPTPGGESTAPQEKRSGVLGRLRRREPEAPAPGSPDLRGQAPSQAPAPTPPLQPAPAAEPRQKAAAGSAEDEIRGLTLVVEGLAAKVEALEKRIDNAARGETQPVEPPPPAPAPAAPAPAPTAPVPALPPEAPSASPDVSGTGEGLDLNRATFDDLRGLGLSVTQSKRLIANREQRGGFGSVDEIEQLPGFSREQLEHLKRSLTV
jgi:DNA uptake protein ComE-like DNA-binding protein